MAKATRIVSHSEGDRVIVGAAGVGGYALAVELLIVLEEKGLLDRQTCSEVFDRALANVETMKPQLPEIRAARALLWSAIE